MPTAGPAPKTYLSAAETAKLVRGVLKHAFPGVKFSVRSDTGSINVKWTDGPTGRDVDAVVKGFAGSGFDGMQDLKYSISHWRMPDGTFKLAHVHHNLDPQTFGKPHPDATPVQFGADFVFTSRTLSKGLMERAAQIALATYGMGAEVDAVVASGVPLVEDTSYGPRWNPALANKWTGSRWASDVFALVGSRLRGDGTLTHDANGFDLLQAAQDRV